MYGQPPGGYGRSGPLARVAPMSDGFHGTSEVVAAMGALATGAFSDEWINRLARSATARCRSHDVECEVQTLYDHVRADGTGGFRYTSLPLHPGGLQRLQTPLETLRDAPSRSGECASLTTALAALLLSLGVEVRLRTVGTDPIDSRFFEHVYLVAAVPGRGWVPLDPSYARAPGWEDPRGVSAQTWGLDELSRLPEEARARISALLGIAG